MNLDQPHYREELQDLLDARLTAEQAAEVQRHVAECPVCQSELESLRWVKRTVASQLPKQEVPAELRDQVLRKLNAADKAGRWSRTLEIISKPRVKLALAFALPLVALIILLPRFLHRGTDLPSQIAEAYQKYQQGQLPVELRTEDVREMESFFRRSGITFEARVFDLRMMRYSLIGGSVHQFDHRKSALFAYRGDRQETVVCQMYLGDPLELPKPQEQREHNGIRFHVYRQGQVTLVFWQEGHVMCVLASDIGSDDLIQLAFAKAMRV